MSPLPIAVEVCSGPNDGETHRSDTGTFTVGTRGAANLPLAGERDLPELAAVAVEAVGDAFTITADTEFSYAGATGRMSENVALPAMIRLGNVDLCISPTEAAITPEAAAEAAAEAPPAPPAPETSATTDSGSTGSAAEATGPVCPDCGLVNKPGAARCERCRRWLD